MQWIVSYLTIVSPLFLNVYDISVVAKEYKQKQFSGERMK
jgi:hypothetical protein